MDSSNKMVAIRSYDNYIQANMQLALLKDSGIHCYLQDENTITIDPLLSPAIGGMKLMVKKEDELNANYLLDTAEAAYLEELPCTRCGKKTIQKIVSKKTFNTVWAQLWCLLKNGQAEEQKTIYKCYSCGYVQDNL